MLIVFNVTVSLPFDNLKVMVAGGEHLNTNDGQCEHMNRFFNGLKQLFVLFWMPSVETPEVCGMNKNLVFRIITWRI